jgi:hypothetical protein
MTEEVGVNAGVGDRVAVGVAVRTIGVGVADSPPVMGTPTSDV